MLGNTVLFWGGHCSFADVSQEPDASIFSAEESATEEEKTV